MPELLPPVFASDDDCARRLGDGALLFGDRWSGPESHQAELEDYQVLDGHDLPVPRHVASGQSFPGATAGRQDPRPRPGLRAVPESEDKDLPPGPGTGSAGGA